MKGTRGVAFAGLAAIAGCNQIYGLDDVVVVIDAPPGADAVDAMLPTARLSRLVAVTASPSGGPSATPMIVPVEPAPTIEVGAIDGPLMQTAYRADGTFDIPYAFATTPWRLVYTADGDVPHELHWSPAAGAGHATIPHLGGLDRATAPPNAELVLTPMNLTPPIHSFPVAFTTGSWTEMRMSTVNSATVQYRFDAARTVGVPVTNPRPRLAPAPTKGDRVLLVDYEARNTTIGAQTEFCRVSTRSAAFAVELGNGPSSDPSPPVMSNNGGSAGFAGFPSFPTGRIAFALNELPSSISKNFYVGIATNTVLPQFLETALGAPLPMPAMLTLAQCLNPIDDTTPIFDRTQTALTRIGHYQFSASQTIVGVGSVSRGIETVALMSGDTAQVDLEVGIPKIFKLDGEMVTYIPTDPTATDDYPLAAGSGSVALAFELDEDTRRADYYVVTLFKIEGSALVPVRRYTMTARAIPIDRALLVAGGRYVLRVVSFNGAPGASIGDFTTYTLPQSSATAYTRSFVAP